MDLLGHVLRPEFAHPLLQQVTFDSATNCQWGRSLAIKTGTTRRKGRPRWHWTTENVSQTWKCLIKHETIMIVHQIDEEYDRDNSEMSQIISDCAKAYKRPFEGALRRTQRMGIMSQDKDSRPKRQCQPGRQRQSGGSHQKLIRSIRTSICDVLAGDLNAKNKK